MKIKFYGTRGSIPVTGKNFCKYGGNTPCIGIFTEGINIIIDAGTGIREAGIDLIKANNRNTYIYFSHFHTDHIAGLPFFAPFYNSNFEIKIFGLPYVYSNIEDIIDIVLKPPLFSITRESFKSKLEFVNINSLNSYEFNNVKIDFIQLKHPNPTLGYKITANGQTIIYFTDNELLNSEQKEDKLKEQILVMNKNLIEFCEGADILIHDTSYLTDDYNKRIGWGHSTNKAAAMFAHLAKVKKLFLFHYAPEYTDEMIDKMCEETRNYIKYLGSNLICEASFDGLEIEI